MSEEEQKNEAPIDLGNAQADDEDKGSRLVQFTGTECDHCHAMEPTVKEVEQELGIKLTKLEIWHNEKNAKYFEEIDGGWCGGIPMFYNEKNGKRLCGEQDKEKLTKWAQGELGE